MKWDKSPKELIDTFYAVMEHFPGTTLKKMFGYPCAFFQGNMFIGLHEKNLILRLDPEYRQALLDKGVGKVFVPMKGRVMRQYVALPKEIIMDQEELKGMIERSLEFVGSIPPK